MATAMQAYGIANVLVAIDGLPLDGLADGDDCFDVEKNVDDVTTEMSADGKQMVVSLNADYSAKVTIKLQWESPANRLLMAIYDVQKTAARIGGTLVAHTLTITDINRQDRDRVSPCVFLKGPKRTGGKKRAAMEWTFIGAESSPQHGPGVPVIAL